MSARVLSALPPLFAKKKADQVNNTFQAAQDHKYVTRPSRPVHLRLQDSAELPLDEMDMTDDEVRKGVISVWLACGMA